MVNFKYLSQYINKNTMKRAIKYNLTVNNYNSDNLKIEFSFNFNIMGCSFNYNNTKYYLEFTTLPYNFTTIYALNRNDIDLPYHLLKSMFGALGFTNILSPKKLWKYSKKIYDNLYITELYDELNHIKNINIKNYPIIKETYLRTPLHYYIEYFLKVDKRYNTSVIKFTDFPYAILYNIFYEKNINDKTVKLQKRMKIPFLYIYCTNEYPYKFCKEKTIYTFNSVRGNSILDIRILGI